MSTWLLMALIGLLSLLLGGGVLASCALRRDDASARGRHDEVTQFAASDGWNLQLARYRGTGVPVIICHGIASCGRNLDLSDERSIARALHARGHDVWLLDLRGCGGSRNRPSNATSITFDDFVRLDGPAAIAHVLNATGAAHVDWVGFSMGGIIGTALLGEPCRDQIRTLTIIGSPLRVGTTPLFGQLLSLGLKLFRFRGAVPLRSLSRLGARMPRWLVAPFVHVLINQRNVTWSPMRLMMDQSVEDIPTALLDQMNGWHQNDGGHVGSRDHSIDYVRRLAEAPPVPLLCIVGTGDRLGPVMAATPALKHHRGPRHLRVVGRGANQQVARWAPEGIATCARELPNQWKHVDLIVGVDAPMEVYTPVGDFLASTAS